MTATPTRRPAPHFAAPEPVERLPRTAHVLLIAEACNPSWTSVPLVGYNVARALARRPDLRVTVVTHVRNKEALAADPLGRSAAVHFIDTEWLARPVYKLNQLLRRGGGLSWTTDTAMAWPGSVAFEHAVARAFGRRFGRGDFDLIYRVTPLTPTVGSPLASLTDVPMVVGPLNGGLPWPREFPELRRREREWLAPLRRAYRHLPYYASTYRRLAAVVAASRHTATEVPRGFRGPRYYLPENGVDPERFPVADGWPEAAGRFRFITVGRLVPYKGVDLTLEAMAGSPALRECELVVVGDGPERANLEEQARRLGLAERARFLGWLDQSALAGEYRRAQAFAFPSLREFGGGVVLEALASGLPAVVVDYGGPGELVTPECGVRVPLAPRGELVPALRAALESLAGEPGRCRRLGAAACERVRREFTWDAKAARLVGVYAGVMRPGERGA